MKKEEEKKKVVKKGVTTKKSVTKKTDGVEKEKAKSTVKTTKKNQSIPMNKFSIRVGIVVGVLLVIFLVLSVLANLHIGFGNFVWLYIRNPIFGFLFKIFSIFPTIGTRFPMIITFFTLVCLVFIIFFEVKKTIKFKKRVFYSNIFLGLMFINLFLMLGPGFLTTSEYGYGKINYEYFDDNVSTKYTKDDLIELNRYYQEKILDMSHSYKRENGSIVYEKDMLDTSVNNLLNISNKYKFLKGWYPSKVDAFSKLEHESNVDQTLGYTMGYGIKVDTEGDKVMLMHVLTHELCHSKGLVRESETEFCAYVAGIHGDDLSRYAAYLDAFGRVNYALYMIDEDLAYDIEEPVLNLCLNEGYEEICGFYTKEINHYINDSYSMEISSYRLRNYVNYFDEFSSILSVLEKDYNAKFSIGERQNVTIGAVQAEINNGSNEFLGITINLDEEKFEQLSTYLKDCDEYFLGIYQINDDTEEVDDMTSEEALEYYLRPFRKHTDIDLVIDGEFMDEYDYERVSRLLLEYHHNEIKSRLLNKK